MNERQRAEYLEAMGIHVFVPRYILPSASASRQALLPEPSVIEAEREAGSVDTTLNQTERTPVAGGGEQNSNHRVSGLVSGIIDELAGKEPVVRSKVPVDAAHSPAKRVLEALEAPAPVETVHFSLSLWRVSESLLVIDAHQARQALPTGTLLSNMLFAKGLSSPLPPSEVLAWPMVGSRPDEGGWLQASEMVQAFLNARLERQPVQFIWLMGEAAYRAVFAGESDYQECFGQLKDLPALGCLATVLPSLQDMLKTPSLKAPAWQAIKAQKVV